MDRIASIFRLAEIPDRTASDLRIRAGGDAFGAVCKACGRLRGAIAALPADSVCVTFRLVMDPGELGEEPQRRLQVCVIVTGNDDRVVQHVGALLQRGPTSSYFRLDPVTTCPSPWPAVACVTYLVRAEESIPPLVAEELNPRVPQAYYLVHLFEPDADFDWLAIDEIADRLEEPFVLDVTVAPVDGAAERAAHSQYLAILNASNQPWSDEDDAYRPGVYLADEPAFESHYGRSRGPTPARDPLADDILRQQRRFHETLCKPHLLFSIRVFTRDATTGLLLSSVLGESAFLESSYRTVQFGKDDPFFESSLLAAKAAEPRVIPTHETLFTEEERGAYAGLARLASMASSEELDSIVRLPIATDVPPRCIHSQTDPPVWSGSDTIAIGYDL